MCLNLKPKKRIRWLKLQLENIGEVQFVKSPRAKYLRITVKPFTGIRVTVPKQVSYDSAVHFVEQKKDWIARSRQKMANIEQQAAIFTSDGQFHTKYHQLSVIPHNNNAYQVSRASGQLKVYYPEQLDVKSLEVQNKIKAALLWVLRKEAKSYLPFRVKHLAEQHGFNYKRVFVKNLKSRWGSCSHVNNINLNIHLMRLPDHLIDYVILHELVHTIHKNHGPGFWNSLNQITGDAIGLRKEMRDLGLAFF